MSRDTIFSPCRKYRYTLWREWDMANRSFVQFIGLNPSTADETQDDPTVRRCIDFANRWGFGAMCMTNLFALRATDPKVMLSHAEPFGPHNFMHMRRVGWHADLIVSAWGEHGKHMDAGAQCIGMFSNDHLFCLGTNKDGTPKHPLYLPKNSVYFRYR